VSGLNVGMGGTNRSVAEPLYRQIAEDLRAQIESGALAPGSMLTEVELQVRYGASRNTVRDAIKWLTGRGLVEARAGQGTFVTRPIDPFISTLSDRLEAAYYDADGPGRLRIPSASLPRVEIQEAGPEIAGTLGLAMGAQVVSRQQYRLIDGAPWSLQTSFYSMELVARGAQLLLSTSDIMQGTLAYLKETLGLDQVGYQDRIRVRPPDTAEAGFFRLPDNGRISVITIVRTDCTADSQGPVPFRVTVTIFAADRNQLLINWGEVPDPAD
jgi:GntR family transcriptional regulator